MRALALSLVIILTVMAASLLRSIVSCSMAFGTRPLLENTVAKIKLYLILAGLNAVVLLQVFNGTSLPQWHHALWTERYNGSYRQWQDDVRSLCSYICIHPTSVAFQGPENHLLCVCVCWHRLLDVLADRKGRKGWSGDILVNGKRRPKNFKCLCGYVVQVIKHFYS